MGCPPTDPGVTTLNGDCFSDRKTQKEISEAKGIIKIIANEYILVIEDNEYQRYQACNLGEEFNTEGLTVIFSGMIKEIYPHERRIAIPFVLTKIQLN